MEAKLKFKHNHFEIISNGDYVICGFKKIPLENLNYWNVELQEAYFSPVEVKIKQGQLKESSYFHLLCVSIHCPGFFGQPSLANYLILL